jgi:hypothetical protein
MRLSTTVRNAAANATVDLVDAGSGAGTLQLRDGTAPAGPAEAATGTLIAAFTLNDPSFGDSVAGVATAVVSPAVTTTAAASGTPTWYRVLDSNGVAQWDGDVDPDMTISPASITIGATVTLTSWTITMPAS